MRSAPGYRADGVLTILPARSGGAAYVHIYNSDGSVAKMCGNVIRCVARWLAERSRTPNAATGGGEEEILIIETDSGPRACKVHRNGQGDVEAVSVDMGPVRLEKEESFAVGGNEHRALRSSTGSRGKEPGRGSRSSVGRAHACGVSASG